MLMEILAAVDPDLFGRAQALRRNVRVLADALRACGQLEARDAWSLELAALLAQVGAVTVPAFVAHKARRGEEMNEAERKMWGRVPEVGYGLLRNVPRLEPVAEIVRYQHKHFDGGGLPDGPICGELIPLGARMLKVLLDLAEIEAGHASRSGAFALMQRQSQRYDPAVLDAARRCLGETERAAPPPPSVALPLSRLASGHVLAEDVATQEGKVLLTAGRRLTDVLLERLHNYAALAAVKEPICVYVLA